MALSRSVWRGLPARAALAGALLLSAVALPACSGDSGTGPGGRTGSLAIAVAAPGQPEPAAAKVAVAAGVLRVSSRRLPTDIVQRVPVVAGRLTATVTEVPVGRADVELRLVSGAEQDLWHGAAVVYIEANTTARASIVLRAVDETPPVGQLRVEPGTGPSTTAFAFLATVDDRHDATESLQVRFDFDGDGTFDLGWTADKGATHRYPTRGDYTARLQVRDAAGQVAEATALVSVVNTAPVARATATLARRDQARVLLDGRGSTDPDGDALAYVWSQTAGVPVVLQDAGQALAWFAPVEAGQYAFVLTVDDGQLASAPAPVGVRWPAAGPEGGDNQAPRASASAAPTALLGQRVVLDGSDSLDPDGDVLAFLWTQVQGPATELVGTDTAHPEFVADRTGLRVFELVVTDGAAASPPVRVQVDVLAANRAPEARAVAPAEVTVGAMFALDGSGSWDADGDDLSFSWRQLAGPSAVVLPAGAAAVETVASVAGGYTFALQVTDARGGTASITVQVRVVEPDTNPTATAEIVFAAAPDGLPSLYVAQLAGHAALRRTHPPSGGDLEPDVAADGSAIVFASFRDELFDPLSGQPAAELYAVNADGTNLRRLTDNRWPERHPSWSPDGLRVAFDRGSSTDATGRLNTGICVVFASGSGVLELTPGTPVYESAPDWSPDGTRLVYAAGSGVDALGVTASVLVRIDADGEHRTQLTFGSGRGRDIDPAWSPAGDKIAFASDRDGTFDVYVMNPDGSAVVNVTPDTPGDDWDPSWGPDGNWVAFVSDRGGADEVYVMPQPGAQPRRLLDGYPNASGPVWRAVAVASRGLPSCRWPRWTFTGAR